MRPNTRRAIGATARVAMDVLRRLRPADLPLTERIAVPEGRVLKLPGRGETFVVDVPGPSEDAPTLLLFHGLGTTTHLTWFTTIGALAERYRVVAFDQRWHGRGIRSERFRLDDCADDAAALLDVLELAHVTAVGYSLGGALAQVFWRRHPARVSAMVLCSTAMRWTGNIADRSFFTLLRAATHLLRPTARERVHLLAQGLPPVPEPLRGDLRTWARQELLTTSLWSLPEILAELGRYDSSRWMGDVTVPTAVVVTSRDRAIPTVRQRALADRVPDALVWEAPGGHTSLVLDTRRWLPIFLDAVAAVTERPSTGRAAI